MSFRLGGGRRGDWLRGLGGSWGGIVGMVRRRRSRLTCFLRLGFRLIGRVRGWMMRMTMRTRTALRLSEDKDEDEGKREMAVGL